MSKVRSDNISNRADDGAPALVYGAEVPVGYGITGAGGINITGVATAASFSGNLTGNATGLTGTPDIAVRNITGVAATFTGVLTYEDVTNIDSIGIITARAGVNVTGGSVGINSTTPSTKLDILRSGSGVVSRFGKETIFGELFVAGEKIGLQGTRSSDSAVSGFFVENPSSTGTSNFELITVKTAGSERLRITSAGAAIFKGGLAEKYESAGTTLGSQPDNPLSDGNVILFTGNESGNKTINFTGVHATLSNGETVSFTVIITPNNSGKITAVQVDGQTPAGGLKWSGGSAPSAGSSGQDIYTFQILKTGSANTAYTVFGAAANYS